MTVAEVAKGLEASAVVHVTFPAYGFKVVTRHCTVCHCELPKFKYDGSLDTFPRCSAHAF